MTTVHRELDEDAIAAIAALPPLRKRRGATRFMVGDWACARCGSYPQWGDARTCFTCTAPRPMDPLLARVVTTRHEFDEKTRDGDWVCANPMCRDVQFADKIACRKCRTPRPRGGGSGGGGGGSENNGGSNEESEEEEGLLPLDTCNPRWA